MTFTDTRSAEFCGCDPGADHLCEQHKLTDIKAKLKWLLDNTDSCEVFKAGPYLEEYSNIHMDLYDWSTS